jgi:hypothetical protein
MMTRSVIVTTPIPTLEEFGKRLGLSKARQKSLMQIMMGGGNGASKVARKDRRLLSSSIEPAASVCAANHSASKSNTLRTRKSERASVSG